LTFFTIEFNGYDQIDTARRLANGTTVLGKWYDEAILKCLRCDFTFGADLRRPELQRMVYNDIVYPMEDILQKLKGLNL
jgi:hypothetical protein